MHKDLESVTFLRLKPSSQFFATPKTFEYFNPSTVDEAVFLLEKYEGESRILAGGQSLVPLMKKRVVSPRYLIDINRIKNLSYINEAEESTHIGSLTTHHMIETNDLIKSRYSIIIDAAKSIGFPQVRNRGTIGGSLAYANPKADYLPVMIALGAKMSILSTKGMREINMTNYPYNKSAKLLENYELIIEIIVPCSKSPTGGAYLKLSSGVGSFAIVSVAVVLSMDQEGVCSNANIVLGGVCPTPVKAESTERFLLGKILEDKIIEESSWKTVEGLIPVSDNNASAEYKQAMARTLAKRTITLALSRAKEDVRNVA
jgi:carbon-monoxide dehydrogenase medium subunit